MTVVKRLVKGSELTHAELDGNFEHLLVALADKADAGHVHPVAGVTGLQAALDAKVDAAALASKQDTLVSGTNIKTVNGESILGAGDISTAPQITVSATAPATPVLNQLWLDIS